MLRQPAMRNEPIVCAVRLAFVAATAACCFWQSHVDDALQMIWNMLRSRRVVQHDSFEPLVVAVSFALWHFGFYCLDAYLFFELKGFRLQASEDRRHWKVEGKGRHIPTSCACWVSAAPGARVRIWLSSGRSR